MNIYNNLIEQIEPTLSVVPLLMVIFAFIGLSLNPNLKGKKRIIIRILAICSFFAFMLYATMTMVFFEEKLPLIARLVFDIIMGFFAVAFFAPIIDLFFGTKIFPSIIYGILKYCNMSDIVDEKDKSKEQENENSMEHDDKISK